MPDLSTRYMGLELENPLIAASSGLTGSLENVKRIADAGAAAVVLKSMFEEVIVAQSEQLNREMMQTEHPEAYEYMRAELGMRVGPAPYLNFISEVKGALNIPVIASVNCVSSKWWAPYAREIELAGADAIELNISHFPGSNDDPAEIEKQYVETVSQVSAQVTIPLSVKLNPYFTSIAKIADELVHAGAKGLVLFNRLYSVDVDLKRRKVVPGMSLSSPGEMALPLRWIGTLYGNVNGDLAASTGIHDSDSILKMLMVGASAVQLCSILYKKSPDHIAVLLKEIESWLAENDCSSLKEIQGVAQASEEDKQSLFKRLQYVKALEEAAQRVF